MSPAQSYALDLPAGIKSAKSLAGKLRGERSLLQDGEDSLRTVAVTQAVLRSIDERRSVAQ